MQLGPCRRTRCQSHPPQLNPRSSRDRRWKSESAGFLHLSTSCRSYSKPMRANMASSVRCCAEKKFLELSVPSAAVNLPNKAYPVCSNSLLGLCLKRLPSKNASTNWKKKSSACAVRLRSKIAVCCSKKKPCRCWKTWKRASHESADEERVAPKCI